MSSRLASVTPRLDPPITCARSSGPHARNGKCYLLSHIAFQNILFGLTDKHYLLIFLALTNICYSAGAIVNKLQSRAFFMYMDRFAEVIEN